MNYLSSEINYVLKYLLCQGSRYIAIGVMGPKLNSAIQKKTSSLINAVIESGKWLVERQWCSGSTMRAWVS